MQWKEDNGSIVITGAPLDIKNTLDCGQCFLFSPFKDGMIGTAGGRAVYIFGNRDAWRIYPATKEDFCSYWRSYFDLDTDYRKILEEWREDPLIAEAAKVCSGLRLLRQDAFETIIAFIVSANNNISRIKKILHGICRKVGRHAEVMGQNLFLFPTPEALANVSEEELRALGCGYRAPYIKKTAQMIAQGFSLVEIEKMDDDAARACLQQLPGIGPKVADCILLFAYGRRRSFPLDVWMRRVLAAHYDTAQMSEKQLQTFASTYFGENGGVLQQYLFHYARMNPDKI